MIPWLAALAWAAPAEELENDYRSYLDQARFFVKRGWYADAEEQLELAVRHPDGVLDPEVWFLLANVRYELADLAGARQAAERALTQSREPAQAEATREWLTFLDERFGMVELVGPRPGLSSRVTLELQGMILDPELKTWYQRALDRLSGPVDLPVTIGLPAGFTYEVNGAAISVDPGQTTRVPLDVSGVLVQSIELHLSAGVSAWADPALVNLFPAPGGELGIVLPVGPLVLGARGGAFAQGYEDPSGGNAIVPVGTGSIELGVEDPAEDAIALRLGGSVRMTRVPGLRVWCPANDDCRALDPIEGRQADRVTAGGAVLPGLWISAAWLDRSRSSSLGVGIRAVGERALGTIDDPVTNWEAWGMRVLLDVSWAL